jgi:hypothetical protein
MADDKVNMIYDILKDFKEDVNKRLEKIENKIDGLVTKEECVRNHNDDSDNKKIILAEWSYKRAVVIAGIFSGGFGVIILLIKTLFK